ncbi:HpcH/HpaI aldolase/citrate lyase family protein [Rhodococcoides corynebacterioides]|uniref:HpcH/HpaI aldolase/citrate lyase family protein n=1 Tax=Rhodococcoides corynebacterioides TaxID=53972 RepID=UPI001C9BB1AE|nr:aldolase/citrate lyase family protein [Rhodococcus corynebacterioides]MBY6350886.1 CoA ester lyase [Rhodococcus corynebacterioides]
MIDARSFLYVPAVKPTLFDKAASGPADAIILDLEDAVPLQHKDTARRDVAAWLDGRTDDSTAQVWIRVSPDFLDADLDVAVHPSVTGIVVAKCSQDTLERTVDEITDRGTDTLVVGLIETAAALRHLDRLATVPKVATFGIGEVDLLADLRITRSSGTQHVVDALRLDVVIGCAAAGLAAPIAPTSTNFRDLDEFARTTAAFVELGFRARTAVHPGQVSVINDAFTPSDEQLAGARRLVDLFDRAAGGPTVDDDGRFVDEAVVRGARELLARAHRPA